MNITEEINTAFFLVELKYNIPKQRLIGWRVGTRYNPYRICLIKFLRWKRIKAYHIARAFRISIKTVHRLSRCHNTITSR